MPTAAAVQSGDVSVTVGSDAPPAALHVGSRLRIVFPPSQVVDPPTTPDETILARQGRSCRPDGTAVFTFTGLRPGTVVFVLLPGPRCLHGHPACLPAQREVPLRIDVVA